MPQVAVRVWRPRAAIADGHSFLVGHTPQGVSGIIGYVPVSVAGDGEADRGPDPDKTTTVWEVRCSIETLRATSALGSIRRRNPLHTEIVGMCNDLSAAGRPPPARAVRYLFARSASARAACARDDTGDDGARTRNLRRRGLPVARSAGASAGATPASPLVGFGDDDDASGASDGTGAAEERGTAAAAADDSSTGSGPPEAVAGEAEEREAPAAAVVFRDAATSALCILLVPTVCAAAPGGGP